MICATGFTPTAANWGGLKPNSSMPVEKQGTINLLEASKAAGGVKHFVLVSSLLTNAVACNQTNSSSYKVLQAFGGVLGAKREAESYLQDSGYLGLALSLHLIAHANNNNFSGIGIASQTLTNSQLLS